MKIPSHLESLINTAINLSLERGEDEKTKPYWSVYREDVFQIWYNWKLERLAIKYFNRVVLAVDKTVLVHYLKGEWEQFLSLYIKVAR